MDWITKVVGKLAGAGARAGSQARGPLAFGMLRVVPDIGSSGPGLILAADVVPHEEVHASRIAFRFLAEDGYLAPRHAAFEDEDGDLEVPAVFGQPADGAMQVIAFLPYAALPARLPREVDCEVVVLDRDGDVVAEATWTMSLPRRAERLASPFSTVPAAAVALATAAGELRRGHVRVIRETLAAKYELDELGHEALRKRLKQLAKAPPPVAEAAASFEHLDDESLTGLLGFLVAVAEAEGARGDAEQAFLLEFSALLGASEDVMRAAGITQRHAVPESLDAYYAVLELPAGASWAEVRAAYRRLAADYHPDKVAQLPVGFQHFATEKMKSLNAAYEALRAALAV